MRKCRLAMKPVTLLMNKMLQKLAKEITTMHNSKVNVNFNACDLGNRSSCQAPVTEAGDKQLSSIIWYAFIPDCHTQKG